jgi:TolB-like protein
MKIFKILLVSLIGMNFVQAQATKVAILDFENTSGKTEYDALTKAISSMLITDLANNIHPKKVEFFERSQLNKLLDEQKLQKSKNFDAKTAVDFGKLSGVNYVFVGSVFVLDGTCNFSSKLVDVQTSKILLAKDVSGTIVNFLQLKSQLAEAIAIQLNNPITLDPSYKDESTTLSTINQYGKILTTMDQGDAEKAEQMRSLFEETNPDFKYFKEIKDDIEELKKQVEKNTADIEVLNKSGGRVVNAQSIVELMNNLGTPLSTFAERKGYVKQILKFEIETIHKEIGQFSRLFHFPLSIELLNTASSGDIHGVIQLFQNNLNFINELLVDGKINKRTTSYFAFSQLAKVWTFDKYKILIPRIIEVCEELNKFNINNNIGTYSPNIFGPGFISEIGESSNLSVNYLIDHLKKKQ